MIHRASMVLVALSAVAVLAVPIWRSKENPNMKVDTPPGQTTSGVVVVVDDECDVMVRVRGEEITPELRAKRDRLVARIKALVREGR